jgi:aldehyde:ferredoxin oxidoreductase
LSAQEAPGVFGKTVVVDLSVGAVREVEESQEYHRRFLGGAGAAVYHLLRELVPGTDPLSPENVLVFAPGLLAGTQSPATPRYVACARSPLTGALGKSESSGYWGPELKHAGVGVLVVTGRAAEPSYLLVTSEGVEIRSALRIWGLTTGEAQDIIKDEVGGPPGGGGGHGAGGAASGCGSRSSA